MQLWALTVAVQHPWKWLSSGEAAAADTAARQAGFYTAFTE